MTDAHSLSSAELTWTVINCTQLSNILFQLGPHSSPLTFSGIIPRSGMCLRWRTSLLAQGDPPQPLYTISVGSCEVEISVFLIFAVMSCLFFYVLCRHEPRVSWLLYDWTSHWWSRAVPSHRVPGSGLEDSDEISGYSHGSLTCYIWRRHHPQSHHPTQDR